MRECSVELIVGEMQTTMITLALSFRKLSLSIIVILLPLNGTCFCLLSSALIHSFKAIRDLLISADS